MSFGSKAALKDGLPVNLSNAVAGGTTLVTTSIIDMAQGGGYTALGLMALLGAVVDTAVIQVNFYGSPNSDGSSPTLIGSSSAVTLTNAANSNKIMAAQLMRTSYRYVYATISRTTANIALQGVIGFLTETRQFPGDVSSLVGGQIYNVTGV